MVVGAAGYVLPRFENKVYLMIEEGKHFGHTELAADRSFIQDDISYLRKSQVGLDLIRRFTVQAFDVCDILSLSLGDIVKMKLEFPRVFYDLFYNARERLRREMILKIEAIKNHEKEYLDHAEEGSRRFQAMFACAFLGSLLKKLRAHKEQEGHHYDDISLKISNQNKSLQNEDKLLKVPDNSQNTTSAKRKLSSHEIKN